MSPTITPVLSLDASYYTDPAIFQREKAGVLSRTWQFAGHISSLRSAGDYFAFTVAGENLFCLRDHDGEVRCFYNVCQHRAHELVTGSGQLSGRVIVCPYHAWSYKTDGQFLNGPNVDVVPGFDKARICLTAVKLEIFCGFIFVNLDDQAASMSQFFPGVAEELRAFVPDIAQLEPLEWVEIPERCNWKLSIENYSECYHCSLNHPTFSTGIIKPETYDIQPQGYCLRHTTECQNLESMSYPIDPSANAHAGEYSSWFLWPGFSFQVYPGNVLNIYHWKPVSVDEVIVNRGWFTLAGQESAIIRELAVQDRQTTVEEDIHLVESVARGLKSRGYRPGPLVLDPKSGVRSEHSIAVLHQWMREGINE